MTSASTMDPPVTEQSAHILVVEDEAALAELIRYNLAAQGLRVTIAASGEEAEMLVDEEAFDLVVLDWMLPGLSGLELCRRLRKRDATRALRELGARERGPRVRRLLDAGA